MEKSEHISTKAKRSSKLLALIVLMTIDPSSLGFCKTWEYSHCSCGSIQSIRGYY